MLSTASSVAACAGLIWAAALAWLAIGAAIRRAQLERRFERSAPASMGGRRVLVVRPCAGAEPGLLDNLCSVARLETAAELRVVMAIDDEADGARPVIEAALERLRGAGLDASLELHAPTGPNRKASLIASTLAAASAEVEIIVNVDSNVDLGAYELDRLLAPLLDADAHVGVAWAPWSELRTHAGLGPRASEAVLGASLTAFPLLCGIYSYGLVGKIWAARREALEACEPGDLTRYLAEDLEMARRLRAQGWAIVAAPVLGLARGGDPSFAEVVARFGRWMLAVRGQRPALMATYPLFFFATPMVLGLAALGALAEPWLATIAAALAVVARLIVTLAAQHWSRRRVSPLRALVEAALGDLALGLAWLRAVTGREVEWRGHRLRVEADGRLSARPDDGASAPARPL